MIASLQGSIEAISGNSAVVNVGGVGYEVVCSHGCLDRLKLNETAKLVVFTCVREDAITLYGFADRLEKQVFSLLLRVKGLGAKSAANIVSQIDKLELLRSIGAGDVTRLQGIRGVGKKTAERMVVELRDKVMEFASEEREGAADTTAGIRPVEDAVQALQALGFIRKDAERAVQLAQESLPESAQDAGELVKAALRFV